MSAAAIRPALARLDDPTLPAAALAHFGRLPDLTEAEARAIGAHPNVSRSWLWERLADVSRGRGGCLARTATAPPYVSGWLRGLGANPQRPLWLLETPDPAIWYTPLSLVSFLGDYRLVFRPTVRSGYLVPGKARYWFGAEVGVWAERWWEASKSGMSRVYRKNRRQSMSHDLAEDTTQLWRSLHPDYAGRSSDSRKPVTTVEHERENAVVMANTFVVAQAIIGGFRRRFALPGRPVHREVLAVATPFVADEVLQKLAVQRARWAAES